MRYRLTIGNSVKDQKTTLPEWNRSYSESVPLGGDNLDILPECVKLSVFIGRRIAAVTEPDKMSGAARVLSGFSDSLMEEK